VGFRSDQEHCLPRPSIGGDDGDIRGEEGDYSSEDSDENGGTPSIVVASRRCAALRREASLIPSVTSEEIITWNSSMSCVCG
jgi:hypothetical protein